jgi:hypothetical protein
MWQQADCSDLAAQLSLQQQPYDAVETPWTGIAKAASQISMRATMWGELGILSNPSLDTLPPEFGGFISFIGKPDSRQ